MKLDDNNIRKFEVAKEFCENKARINSIDFSLDGKSLISSSDDDTIVIYECDKGTKKRDINSKKYGVDLIRFTHATNTAIHTSTKENHTIRYLSLHDNKYLRYFTGHEQRVVTLSMSPADDTFLSGSLDQTVRIWDLKSEKPLGKLQALGTPIANYDPEGLVFAVGINTEVVKLYDSRLYDKGPFNTIRVGPKPPNFNWRSLKFSPNGKQILLTTDHEELYVLDAFLGQPIHKLSTEKQFSAPIEHPCEATFSPDSQYILCGSVDGQIYIWSASRGNIVAKLRPKQFPSDPVQCAMFNPKYMLIASASSKMSFWIPSVEPDD